MKQFIFILLTLSFTSPTISQIDKSWYILENKAVANGTTIQSNIVYELENFGQLHAGKELDFFMIFDDNSFLFKTITLPGTGPTSGNSPFRFSSSKSIAYMYVTHKYDNPPPPPNIITPTSTSGNVNLFNTSTPITSGIYINHNKTIVPNEDFTLILYTDNGLQEVVMEIRDDRGRRVTPRQTLDISPIFNNQFSYPSSNVVYDNINKITHQSNGGLTYVNFKVPTEFNDFTVPASQSENPSHNMFFKMKYNDSIIPPLIVPILQANDPNSLVLNNLCLDKLENIYADFVIEFENNGAASTEKNGVVLKMPTLNGESLFLLDIKVSEVTVGQTTYNTNQISDVLTYPSTTDNESMELHFDFVDNISLGINEKAVIKFRAQIKPVNEISRSKLLDSDAISGYVIFSDRKALDISYSDQTLKEEGVQRLIGECESDPVAPPFKRYIFILTSIVLLLEIFRRLYKGNRARKLIRDDD